MVHFSILKKGFLNIENYFLAWRKQPSNVYTDDVRAYDRRLSFVNWV